MKRKFDSPYMGTRSKKPKLMTLGDKRSFFWASGTDVRNYMLNDTLVDWLKDKYVKEEEDDFILKRGVEFEEKLVEYINKNIEKVVTISNKITKASCKKTIVMMEKGVPIIHSAPFQDRKKHIRGVIDLLVRSDYLSKICESVPKLEKNVGKYGYHYVVIDIKFCTLSLCSDGIHLMNTNSFPAYKSQLWIYTDAIAYIQGYSSRYAFILGRRYRYESKGVVYKGYNCLEKLGLVDFEGVDNKYIDKTKEAIEWLKQVRKGENWVIGQHMREELYPNMCIDSGGWNNVKKEIAGELGEITQLWNCGVKNRRKAFEKGIVSWRDHNCNSEKLGIGGMKGDILDRMLQINRQEDIKIMPDKIESNLFGWKNEVNEIFVDFETFSDIFASFDELPYQNRSDMIFMIGLYYKNGEEWGYKCFLIDRVDYGEEKRICNEFVDFVKKLGSPKIWYWNADKTIWKRSVGETEFEWVDLCEVFKREGIVIKNCFSFGLKDIAGAMKEHGMISSKLETHCKSGMSASIVAWKCFNGGESGKMNDIIEYNCFDVKTLYEILCYLRKKMV
jgi:hypothetical protein